MFYKQNRFCAAGAVERVKKIRDYAFVHFTQREDAVNAMNTLNGKVNSCDTKDHTLSYS